MMNWLKSSFAAIALLVGAGTANAQYTVPESGWYWNPVLSGSGINMEFQDSAMFLSYYSYRANGEAVFYTVQGNYDPLTRRVQGTLYTYTGGQCIGCPYVSPTPVAVGAATIQFTSLGNAAITFATSTGTAQFNVQRFIFTLSYYPTVSDQKKGLWAFTTFPPGNLPWGDAVTLTTVAVGANGIPLVLGTYYPFNSEVVGSPLSLPGINYGLVIDYSPTSYALYFGEWTLGHFTGYYEIHSKLVPPTFSGVLAVGSRIAGPATISQILNGPARGPVLDEKAVREREFLWSSKKALALSGSDRKRLLKEVRDLEAQLEWRATMRGPAK